MSITVRRDISGSYCVVFFPMNPWSRDQAYIDAQKTQHPDMTLLECVRGGQVRHREYAHNNHAPQRIIQLVRTFMKVNQP